MKHLHYILFFLLLCANARGQYITTIAGTGGYGFGGDNGPATNAILAQPRDVALDDSGNVFIADTDNSCIRKIDGNGQIVVFAGIPGVNGFSGDSAAATNAQISVAFGIAIDKKGNLYIADYYNHRIRKVNNLGIITTVAGNGVADTTGDGGPATAATVDRPVKVATDRWGRVYISDQGSYRIRRIDTNGIITTVAGNGTPGFSGDGMPATAAQLLGSHPIALDTFCNIYIGDNGRIRKIGTDGVITTIAGTGDLLYNGDGGAATVTNINPHGICLNLNGDIYISDQSCAGVRKMNFSGNINIVAGKWGLDTSDGIPATSTLLNSPEGIAINQDGEIIIAEVGRNKIRKTYQHTESVLDKQQANELLVYPNPAKDGVFYISSNTTSETKAYVVDVTGKVINNFSLYPGAVQRIWLDAPPGLYFVVVQTSSGSVARQLVVDQ